GRRPRGEQRTVDGPDLIDAEEVLEVRGHGGESAPVEGDDDERGQDEEDERTAAEEGDEQVQDRTAAEVEHVVVLPPQVVEVVDQTKRPAILPIESRPTKPA